MGELTRRNFIKLAGAAAAVSVMPGCVSAEDKKEAKNMDTKIIPGTGGEHYVPYDRREGPESYVYFTRDLSAAGLIKMFDRIKGVLAGKVAVKLHTGEPHGPNIIPRPWVKELMASRLPGASIIETNTYYDGGRYTTEDHRKAIETNGWTFCPVDIMDENGTALLPVPNGKWFTEMSMGKDIVNYDSFLALTHFKGYVSIHQQCAA